MVQSPIDGYYTDPDEDLDDEPRQITERHRPEHTQTNITLPAAQAPHSFEGVQFIGHVIISSIKFNRMGAVVFQVEVDRRWTDEALKLQRARLPLSIDMQDWHVAHDALLSQVTPDAG